VTALPLSEIPTVILVIAVVLWIYIVNRIIDAAMDWIKSTMSRRAFVTMTVVGAVFSVLVVGVMVFVTLGIK
jgi:hypothetical protein